MNNHLNIFNAYSKDNSAYQLENDLTRAFAICMQEDSLFLHEVLKYILKDSQFYNQLFEDFEGNTEINIDIQKNTSSVGDFEHIFAVSLSENKMNLSNFWEQQHHDRYDPICDILITINNVVIIFETKRDGVDCTAQLYNQVFNTYNHNKEEIDNLTNSYPVTPIDLSWPTLMELTVKILSFQKSTRNQNRFISDFIQLVKIHNFRWLPEPPISSLTLDRKNSIERRIQSTIEEISKDNTIKKLTNRLGFEFNKPWAQEVLFEVTNEGSLNASIYPGNTKGQGISLFQTEPNFNKKIDVCKIPYDIELSYHIKFTSFQKYFTGLWFTNEDLSNKLYTSEIFGKYTGRKKRGPEWDSIVELFNNCFKSDYDWKKKCDWQNIIDSGKNQFDISFGFEVYISIPFKTLQSIDKNQSDLTGLKTLLECIYEGYSNNLLSDTDHLSV